MICSASAGVAIVTAAASANQVALDLDIAPPAPTGRGTDRSVPRDPYPGNAETSGKPGPLRNAGRGFRGLRGVVSPPRIGRMLRVGWLVLGLAATELAAAPKPLEEPARVVVEVSPSPVAPGSEAVVTLRLEPVTGVKINRYPKIKLTVDAAPGVVEGASAAIGNDAPPPPEAMDSNYFGSIDPLELRLRVDPHATSGNHVVEGRLSYFYCVAASGFCAPAKKPVQITLGVR